MGCCGIQRAASIVSMHAPRTALPYIAAVITVQIKVNSYNYFGVEVGLNKSFCPLRLTTAWADVLK